MFAEYLARQPISAMLAAAPMFPPCGDEAWQAIAPADRQELLSLAASYREQPYPLRLATDFLAFVRSGSRKADENPYFFRRRKLCAAVLGYCLEPNEADMDAIIDGMWLICEESSWVISAHNVNPIPGAPAQANFPLPDVDAPYIDLFAAQTAMILALSCSLLGENLLQPVKTRVEREIRQRVLGPFMATDDFWWMGVKRADLNNWTPWIVSNVMFTALHCPGPELAALLERACVMLDRWLACVPEDGGCDEGAGYWNMAGGALLDCLQILEHATAGRMTFWQVEKIRRVLSFPAMARVAGGWFVNFADCDAKPLLSGERLQFAGERLNDAKLTAMGAEMRGDLAAELNDTPHLSRLLLKLFHRPGPVEPVTAPADVWLPDLQVRVAERDGLILCAKGGHNCESHNHNDVGAFMLYIDGEPEIVDAGNMIYTAKTFSSERYTLWNVRAAYHNVPLIGGHEQQPGLQYAARDVQRLLQGLALDMAQAYAAEAHVQACRRRLELTEDGLLLRDEIDLMQPQRVTWIFMLRHEPTVGPASLTAGKLRLDFNCDLQVEVEELPVTDGRMARSFPGSLWRVKLTEASADRHSRTFVMGRS